MSRQEAAQQYQEALKLGRKTYKERVLRGQYPYPQVLDEILNDTMTAGQVDMGLLDIPAEHVVGTKTQGRRDAFAADFMPLMPADSEFASKWINLCAAHLGDEGIREPVRCFEYLGRFYVQEGNKRVSVLKSFGAPSIAGQVTRIVPVISDRTIVRIAKGERAAKRARWTRIAEDAARQSDAKWIPDILEPVDFSASLALVAETDCLVGALTDPPSPPIAGAGGNAVYIGPEGDFTPDELSALVKVARPVSLGPTILRAETAAIFAVSVLAASMQR